MVEVKRGRGRPRKTPIGVFKLEENKRPVGRPPKKKMGRPKGSKNKPKAYFPISLTIEERLRFLERSVDILADAVILLTQDKRTKKSR